ncbi:MAG: helix-turn-helix transcriptional regulator [Clostridiales bacterium]|nr:helix-turn-helix transcriptional regulator [Clostridiales bacterium]
MDARERIRSLMQERGWSEYRLAIASGLSQSTVANIFNRNTTPSVTTLESICNGFGITLSQFFSESNLVELTADQKQLFDAWKSLSVEQKQLVFDLIRLLKKAGE